MARGGLPPVAKLLTMAALAVIFFWPRRSDAAMNPLPDWEPLPIPSWDAEPEMNASIDAFLFMIRTAEHDPRFQDWQRYSLFYTSIPFDNFSDHPVITKEISPVRLPDRLCAPAGLNPPCYSSAAGAYQIIRPTWERVRKAGSWGDRLPDFSPTSQDEAALRILIEAGVMPYIASGDIRGAIQRASRQWASLPGSTAMQNPKTLDRVLAVFDQGLTRYG